MDDLIAWTPDGVEPQIGMALLNRPKVELTLEDYLEGLERRFSLLVEEAEAEGINPLEPARTRLAEWDGLIVERADDIPKMLVRSETLRTNLPTHLFPIPAEQIKNSRSDRDMVQTIKLPELIVAIYP